MNSVNIFNKIMHWKFLSLVDVALPGLIALSSISRPYGSLIVIESETAALQAKDPQDLHLTYVQYDRWSARLTDIEFR